MFLKPAPGRSVPDPERGGLLIEGGRNVEPTQYWLRRLEDNDVIEAEPEPEPGAKAGDAEVQAPAQTKGKKD